MSERDDRKAGDKPSGGDSPAEPTGSSSDKTEGSAAGKPPEPAAADKSAEKPAAAPADTAAAAKPTESAKTAPAEKPAAPVKRAPRPDPVAEKLKAEVPSVPLDRLRSKMPGAIEEVAYFAGVPIVRLSRQSLVEAGRFLKSDSESDLKYLSNLCGAHYPDREEPFDVVYHLYSIDRGHRLTLKVRAKESETVPTVSDVWRTANWHEREAYDMYGIRFEGHPDMTRILLPDDWNGHPLRKDYPLEGNPGDHKSYRRE